MQEETRRCLALKRLLVHRNIDNMQLRRSTKKKKKKNGLILRMGKDYRYRITTIIRVSRPPAQGVYMYRTRIFESLFYVAVRMKWWCAHTT